MPDSPIRQQRYLLSYNADGRWHCFSCQAKGKGAIDLVMTIKGCSFTEAVDFLETAPQTPATTPVVAQVEPKPFKGSYHKFAVESAWLNARIPDKEVLNRYGVFCYSNPARKSAYSGKILIPLKACRVN